MSSRTPPVPSPRSQGELYRDEYVALTLEPDGVIVRMTRTALPHPSPEVMEHSYRGVARALDKAGRHGRSMLVDSRQAIGRNEPAYEAAFTRSRQRIDPGLSRIAVLLRTSVGMLQVKRFSEEDGTARLITTSEEDALEYLRTGTFKEDPKSTPGKPLSRR